MSLKLSTKDLRTPSGRVGFKPPKIGYKTSRGFMVIGSAEEILRSKLVDKVRGRVDLIFTSPPFPLNRKKKYGNLKGDAYIEWLAGFASLFRDLLRRDGSIVIEVGNAWEPGKPVMSTLPVKALLAFKERGGFHLCQQFVCYNPARLPSPAQWVNVERIRVKDAYTNLWWLSRVERPFASNRRVLKAYSESMLKLLETKKYNSGVRPSEYRIGKKSFLRNNKGAIPSNVLTFTNTLSRDPYLEYCRKNGLKLHPARMPLGLAEFFVKFLTRKSGLVLDPFGGSNTTGAAAESLGRRWISIEPREDYAKVSRGRFLTLQDDLRTSTKKRKSVKISKGKRHRGQRAGKRAGRGRRA